jgi:hypothetical protein
VKQTPGKEVEIIAIPPRRQNGSEMKDINVLLLTRRIG